MDAKTLGMQHAFADDLAYNGRSGLKPVGGLTKRELFAAMAMQGVMAMQSHPDVIAAVAECAKEAGKTTDEYIASNCVSLADALLAELAKEQS